MINYINYINIILVFIFIAPTKADLTCNGDGIYINYEKQCSEFYKCENYTLTAQYRCKPNRVYSIATNQCVPRRKNNCVKRFCSPGEKLAYSVPRTNCRQYYKCDRGIARDSVCPYGTWFDFDRQSCTTDSGACYEPLCTGLTNGIHGDSSHECRRTIECSSGEVSSVTSVSFNGTCDSPRVSSVPIPVGNVDFCGDDTCSKICLFESDGFHPDLKAGCREFFFCSDRILIQRGKCIDGTLFYNGECVPSSFATCSKTKRGICFGLKDGTYRDWRDCQSWFTCKRDRVVAADTCNVNSHWNNDKCVAKTEFLCDGPKYSQICQGRPRGYYQDFNWNCTRYFRCDNGKKTDFECKKGFMFDGRECVPENSFKCPSLDKESCYRKSDGKYPLLNSGCRGYYMCAAGEKSMYACQYGYIFNGVDCVEPSNFKCNDIRGPCVGLKDGYHPDLNTDCRNYFYCQNGDRIARLECKNGKIFNGRSCVDTVSYQCGNSSTNKSVNCINDGFFTLEGSECREYYFCIDRVMTLLKCPKGMLFNGDICVAESKFTCNQ